MTTPARTVRLLMCRNSTSAEGPWDEPYPRALARSNRYSSEWSNPEEEEADGAVGWRQFRVIELPLPPDDATEQLNESAFTPVEWDGRQLVKKADGVNDGEVAEPDIVTHLREWPDRVHPAATHYLKHSEVKAVVEHIDRLIREAAGVREQLEAVQREFVQLSDSFVAEQNARAAAEKRLAEAEALNEALKRGQLDCMSALESAERDVVILRGIRDRAWDKLRELGITVMP